MNLRCNAKTDWTKLPKTMLLYWKADNEADCVPVQSFTNVNDYLNL